MLEAGQKVLDALFPGFLQELQSEGATLMDSGRDLAWQHFGVWKTRYHSGIGMLVCTRLFLEWKLRCRVSALPNVEIRDGWAVGGLRADAGRERVTGVRRRGSDEVLGADLVVDASGRGTRAPRWIEELGYGRPAAEEVGIDLAYTSRLYQRPAGFQDEWKLLIQYPHSPASWRAGFIGSVEGNRWIVSLNGYFGDHAPTDEAGFLAFARSLPQPGVYGYIRDAEPLSAPVTHRIPSSRWLHYERLRRFPEGLVITGDAVCSFNPILGQGMSVASPGARLLDTCLREARSGGLGGLGRRFQRKLSGIIRLPWLLATSLDLHYPQATGARPPGIGALHWYLGCFLEKTSLDPGVYHQLLRVMHFQTGLHALVQPRVSLPVIGYGLKALFVPLAQRANVDTLPPPPG